MRVLSVRGPPYFEASLFSLMPLLLPLPLLDNGLGGDRGGGGGREEVSGR